MTTFFVIKKREKREQIEIKSIAAFYPIQLLRHLIDHNIGYPCQVNIVLQLGQPSKLLHVSSNNLYVISARVDYSTAFRANKAINAFINFKYQNN